jgi:hypothetical protein
LLLGLGLLNKWSKNMKKTILFVQIIAIFILIINIKLIFGQDYPWSGHPKVPIITAKDVKTRILSGDQHIFIDAQPLEFYIKHHVCGAIPFPYNWLPPHPNSERYEKLKIPKSHLVLCY